MPAGWGSGVHRCCCDTARMQGTARQSLDYPPDSLAALFSLSSMPAWFLSACRHQRFRDSLTPVTRSSRFARTPLSPLVSHSAGVPIAARCFTFLSLLHLPLSPLRAQEFLSLAVLSITVALGLFFVPPEGRKDPVGTVSERPPRLHAAAPIQVPPCRCATPAIGAP